MIRAYYRVTALKDHDHLRSWRMKADFTEHDIIQLAHFSLGELFYPDRKVRKSRTLSQHTRHIREMYLPLSLWKNDHNVSSRNCAGLVLALLLLRPRHHLLNGKKPGHLDSWDLAAQTLCWTATRHKHHLLPASATLLLVQVDSQPTTSSPGHWLRAIL